MLRGLVAVEIANLGSIALFIGVELRPIIGPVILVIDDVTNVTQSIRKEEVDDALHDRFFLGLVLGHALLLCGFGSLRLLEPDGFSLGFLRRVVVSGLVGVDVGEGFRAVDVLA
jgi:hypothetical protein